MRILKILSVLIITLCFFACNQESLESVESDETSKVLFYPEKFDTSNQSQLFSKTQEASTELRFIESEEEFNSLCTDVEVIWEDITANGIGISFYFGNPGITSFGGTFTDTSPDEAGITIRVYDYSTNSELYNEVIYNSEPFYLAISANSAISLSITSNDGNNLRVQNGVKGSCPFVPEIPDSDGDGIADDEDLIPNSNMEATVIIDGCNSGVDNVALGGGIMLSDKLDELEAGEYKNHGQYVRANAKYLAELVETGLITNEAKDALMSCAGSSSL